MKRQEAYVKVIELSNSGEEDDGKEHNISESLIFLVFKSVGIILMN